MVLATLIVASGLGIRLVPPSTTAASILNWASVVVPVVGGPSLAWFASRRWGSGDPVADFGLTVRWADVGLGLFGALLLLLGEIVKDVVTVIVRDPLPVGLSLRHANFATAAVAIALVMFRPLAEELLLRGLILRGFESSAGRRAAVAIQLATAGVLGAAMTSGSVAAGAAGGIYAAAILTFLFRRTGRLGTGIIAGMLLAVLATLSLFPPV